MPGIKKRYALALTEKKWTPQHEAMLALKLDRVPATQIAEKLNCSVYTVHRVFSTNYFQMKFGAAEARRLTKIVESKVTVDQDIIAAARAELSRAALKAAQRVAWIAEFGVGTEHRIQLEACKDILDRSGLKPVEVVETRERVYSPEEVASAKAVLTETQEIIARLATKDSPFILSEKRTRTFTSSDTDKGSDGVLQHKAGADGS